MSGDVRDHMNSLDYWQERFASGDWQRNRGEQQTRFFGALAARLLPGWMSAELRRQRLVIADVGCAEGAGTVALAQALPECRVIGIDFAEAAVEKARQLHPGLTFEVGDLQALPAGIDAYFLSNVLEHLPDPSATLQRLANLPKVKFVVILVPLHEVFRHDEHVFTFDYNNFPLKLGSLNLAAFEEVDLRGTPDERFWYGKQAFAVWAHDDALAGAGPTLQSVLGSARRAQTRLLEAREQLRRLEQSDRKTLVELNETRRQLAEAMVELRRFDQQPAGVPEQRGHSPGEATVQFLPDREAEARVEMLKARLEEIESTLKWRLSNRVASSLRRTGFEPLLKLVQSVDELGVWGTAKRLRRAIRRRVDARRRAVPIEVDPWISLSALKPIEVQVLDESFAGAALTPFAVVTTVRNEEESIVSFLRSIAQQRARPEVVVVVDGGSTDATVALVRGFAQSAPFRVHVVDEGPCSIAAGRNRGLEVVSEEVVVFVDAGCTLRSDFLSAMVGPFALSSEIDMVGGIYVAAPGAQRANLFVPDWRRCNFQTYLPSARAVAVRPFMARAAGGFPEHLSHTGEDTLFDIDYRRISRKWAINRAAIVEWSGPSDDASAHKLNRSYSRGDGESGIGERRFYRRLAEHHRGILGPVAPVDEAAFEGFLEGRARRAMVEGERRKIRGVVVVFDPCQLTDGGGDRRIAQLVTELTRQHVKVVHVSVMGPDEPDDRHLDLDQTLIELFHINDFDLSDVLHRYADRILGCLVIGAHPALVPLAGELSRQAPRVPIVLDEVDEVIAHRLPKDVWASSTAALLPLSKARLVTRPENAEPHRHVVALPTPVDRRLFRRELYDQRPKGWPARWKERVVVCPMPSDVSDVEGAFLRSVARAAPTLGFVVLVSGWRFPLLANRWGVVEKNVSGMTWLTPAELASWTANASAVVIPWELESPGRAAWAAGWARRAASMGVPSIVRGDVGEDSGAIRASASTFAATCLSAVDRHVIPSKTTGPTWQESTHQLLNLFFDVGR